MECTKCGNKDINEFELASDKATIGNQPNQPLKKKCLKCGDISNVSMPEFCEFERYEDD
ncbi:MAG: hypothetical protein ACTSPD_10070 [Promethearchaeota archaeon]